MKIGYYSLIYLALLIIYIAVCIVNMHLNGYFEADYKADWRSDDTSGQEVRIVLNVVAIILVLCMGTVLIWPGRYKNANVPTRQEISRMFINDANLPSNFLEAINSYQVRGNIAFGLFVITIVQLISSIAIAFTHPGTFKEYTNYQVWLFILYLFLFSRTWKPLIPMNYIKNPGKISKENFRKRMASWEAAQKVPIVARRGDNRRNLRRPGDEALAAIEVPLGARNLG